MDRHSLPSIEKFAAYLDGNLSKIEMQQFYKMLECNDSLQQIIDANSIIDNTIAGFTDTDLQVPDDIVNLDFDIPDLDKVDFSLINDSFQDNESLYQKEGINAGEILQQESETFNNSYDMVNSYRTIGESGENIYDPIYIKQPDDHSCGLRSQQIILRDFGIDIPFADLERYALDAGVYSENGTYTYDIGKVLEMAGVSMHQVEGSTIYELTNELAQGHRVIVSVDANELWYNDSVNEKMANWLDDVFGDQGGNHALIVAGVEVNPNNPDDVKVVLTDPGAGHLRIEYPLNQFMDAWKDSNCFMAATDNPAPYQYDAATGMEVPSNFAVEQHYNQFITENSYQLNPDMINVSDAYQPAFTGHLAMIGDVSYDEFLTQHNLVSSEYNNPHKIENDDILEDTTGDVGLGFLGHVGEDFEVPELGETASSVGSLNSDDPSSSPFNEGL